MAILTPSRDTTLNPIGLRPVRMVSPTFTDSLFLLQLLSQLFTTELHLVRLMPALVPINPLLMAHLHLFNPTPLLLLFPRLASSLDSQ